MDIDVHNVTGMRVITEEYPAKNTREPFTCRTIFIEINGQELHEIKLYSKDDIKLIGVNIDENAEYIPEREGE